MSARYDKTILIDGTDGEIKAIVVYNEKMKVPVIMGVSRYGMDDVLELFGGVAPKSDAGRDFVVKSDNPLHKD